MYIVKQKINGGDYFYIRRAVRDGKKVMSKFVCYGGKTREDAERKLRELNEPEEGKKIETKLTIEELANFCKKKGFVYQSGEIYGGFAGFWDFGHLGVEMKNNLKDDWWNFHVRKRSDVVGIDGSIISHPKIWEASGHLESFSDIFVICKKCKKPNKIDKNELGKVKCENCGGNYDEKSAKEFKLMFEIIIGENTKSYLRPETAQMIFTNFKFVQDNARLKLPFGIAQIGKSFRNEIAPRDFLFRCREFEQMEIEYFVNPNGICPYEIGESEILVYSAEMQEKDKEPEKMKFKDAFDRKIISTKWHAYWLEQEFLWFVQLGANPDKFRIRQHISEEKSHYALDTWDLDYEFPFGWKELQGMANRTDFDLKQHQEFSKTNLEIIDNEKKILPHVVCEPSQGVERAFLVFLCDAYCFDEKRNNVVLKLHPKLSPVKAAVFPIVKKPEYEKICEDIVKDLSEDYNVVFDKSGSIGRRYARNDEIGTPLCITVDEKTPEDDSVTVRDRDSTKQVRVKIKHLRKVVGKVVRGERLMKLGKKVETRKKEN